MLTPLIMSLIPTYKATANLLIVSETTKDTTVSDPDLPTIVTSSAVLDRVIDRLALHTTSFELNKRIKTKLPPKSSILAVTYKDFDPDRAVAVTNAIADEASAYFHEVATRGYGDVIRALNARIAETQSEIAKSDRLLQHASAKNAFASSDKALDDLTNQIDDLRTQRGQVASSLAADQASASALVTQLHKIQPIVHGEILQKDVVYQQVQAGFGRDVADLESEKSSFKETFPGLTALEHRITLEQKRLKHVEATAIENGAGLSPSYTQTVLDIEHANGTVAADRERLNAIDAQLLEDQAHLQSVAGAGAIVGTLRAQRDATLQQYISLKQRLSAAEGDAAQAASLGSLVVVSRATPIPSSLPLWITLLAGAIILIAIGFGYLVDRADRRFWGNRDMEETYGRPVLVEAGK
jgi:capsular polysaccharide biosynthesis protein